MNEKILWIDYGYFLFRSVFGWKNNRTTPPTYICLASIISAIKKVGLQPEDKVIIAIDSPLGSWRKEVDENYNYAKASMTAGAEVSVWGTTSTLGAAGSVQSSPMEGDLVLF